MTPQDLRKLAEIERIGGETVLSRALELAADEIECLTANLVQIKFAVRPVLANMEVLNARIRHLGDVLAEQPTSKSQQRRLDMQNGDGDAD